MNICSCILCKNAQFCKYREECDKLGDILSKVRDDVKEKMSDLPDFLALEMQLSCRYFEPFNAPLNVSPIYHPPTPIPTSNPYANQPRYSGWVETLGQHP